LACVRPGAIVAAAATGVAALLAAGAPARAASASDARLTVEWSAPAGCPDGARVRAEIERLLRRPLAEASLDPLHVRASVARDRKGLWHMHLETRSRAGSGERSLEGATCEGVARATALIIALAIDPDLMAAPAAAEAEATGGAAGAAATAATVAPPEEADAAVAAADASAAAAAAALAAEIEEAGAGVSGGGAADGSDGLAAGAGPGSGAGPGAAAGARAAAARAAALLDEAPLPETPTLADRARRSRRGEPRLILRTITGGDLASLPGLAAGVGLAVGVLVAPLRFELAAVWWTPQTAAVPARYPDPAASGVFGLETGSARACWSPSVEIVFELPVCLGMEAGHMHGHAEPAFDTGPWQALWVAGVAGAGVAWIPLEWLAILLSADAVFALERPYYTVGNFEAPLFRPARVSGRSFLGVEVRFF